MLRRPVITAAPHTTKTGGSSTQPARKSWTTVDVTKRNTGSTPGSPLKSTRRAATAHESWYCRSPILLALAAIITILTYGIPASKLQEVEHEAYLVEQKLQDEMQVWWQGGKQRLPPIPVDQHPDSVTNHEMLGATSSDKTARMAAHESKWVDGEKKLKIKLKELAARQAQGKDLGVPVLTRYLGEDIPAWVSDGVDEAEWKSKVAARYAEMELEEKEWQQRMATLLETKTLG